jgi:hypothetical protein
MKHNRKQMRKMRKRIEKPQKRRNPVAKYAEEFNKARTHRDRKKENKKKGYDDWSDYQT